jgi:AcrR family transcriptional regulator
MATHGSRRPYRSAYRREQGAAQASTTRQRIAAAARRLFAADGYAATRIEAIAREAGVAVPTVYANFASKRAILDAVAAVIEEDADLGQANAAYLATSDSRDRLRAGLAHVRVYMERYHDVLPERLRRFRVLRHTERGDRGTRLPALHLIRSLDR